MKEPYNMSLEAIVGWFYFGAFGHLRGTVGSNIVDRAADSVINDGSRMQCVIINGNQYFQPVLYSLAQPPSVRNGKDSLQQMSRIYSIPLRLFYMNVNKRVLSRT